MLGTDSHWGYAVVQGEDTGRGVYLGVICVEMVLEAKSADGLSNGAV